MKRERNNTIELYLNDKEFAALKKLMIKKGMGAEHILRAALRTYQLVEHLQDTGKLKLSDYMTQPTGIHYPGD